MSFFIRQSLCSQSYSLDPYGKGTGVSHDFEDLSFLIFPDRSDRGNILYYAVCSHSEELLDCPMYASALPPTRSLKRPEIKTAQMKFIFPWDLVFGVWFFSFCLMPSNIMK